LSISENLSPDSIALSGLFCWFFRKPFYQPLSRINDVRYGFKWQDRIGESQSCLAKRVSGGSKSAKLIFFPLNFFDTGGSEKM
jgi:hypothetical protein